MNAVHLCVAAPLGQTEALAWLDLALCWQRALRQAGVQVSLGRQRLRADRVNLVFGGHLAVEADRWSDHPCILVNTQSLATAQRGALPPSWVRALQEHAVIELDAAHLPAYGERSAGLPVAHAFTWTGAAVQPPVPLAERSIELLFLDALTPHRASTLRALQALGVAVARADPAVCGPERAGLLRSAQAVLLLPAEQGGTFDLVAASNALAAGTPVLAERGSLPVSDPVWADAVQWIDVSDLPAHFGPRWRSVDALAERAARLARCCGQSPGAAWEAITLLATRVQVATASAAAPDRLHADMEDAGYRPGWLNVSARPRDMPDLLLDLDTDLLAQQLEPAWHGRFETVHLGRCQPGEAPALRRLARALDWLQADGVVVLHAVLPPRAAPGAWAQQAWADVGENFWRNGALAWHWVLVDWIGLDAGGLPATGDAVQRVRWVLRKAHTSLAQRARARAFAQDFGLGPDETN